MSTNHNPIDKIPKFDVTNSKKERKFAYEYHHWEAKKKIMDIINEQDKSFEIPSVIGKATGNEEIRFKIDGNLTRKLWVPRRPD